MDYLISMFIDNELDLDEKLTFVDRVHQDPPFYLDARALLQQEQLLRTPPDTDLLPDLLPAATAVHRWGARMIRPLGAAVAGCMVALLVMLALPPTDTASSMTNRFVIFAPDAHQVELTGSFTGWQRTPLSPAGHSGYWQINLEIPAGEHRFAYILDGSRQMADPTISRRERDDFGGENSILDVGERV